MITQILFFVGGVLLSGLIGLVVWMVSVNKKINNLQSEVDDHNTVIDEIFDQLNERDRNKGEQLDQINRRVDTDIENIYRELDSKLDKLEYRLTKQTSTNQ
jgi:outer membrane murein-binding lipoprotein Lpp